MKRALLLLALFCPPLLAAKEQVIHIGNWIEPRDLDPQRVLSGQEMRIVENVFEPLVDLDPKTLNPIPAVAQSWTSSADGLVWTFKLRNDAKWSNGDLVTAEDFVYAWTRLLDPNTASEYAYFAYFIKNAEKFNSKKLADLNHLGIRAKDAHTLELTLESATPYLLKLLYFPSLYPAHRKTIEKFGKNWTRPENMVSNGPFVLSKWEVNKIISLKKSPTYRDKDHVTLTEVHFYPTENVMTEENMFRTGKLHVTWGIPAEKVATWKKSKKGEFQSDLLLMNHYNEFNITKKPLDDKRVRKALVLAVDRTQLVNFVTKGNEPPAYAFNPPGIGDFKPKKRLPIDGSRIAEAKKLLAEAGYKDGNGFPTVELLYSTDANLKKVAEALQEMWKRNLGVSIGIVNQEYKVFLNTLRNHDFQISMTRWGADYDDPMTFFTLYVTGGGNNTIQFNNPKYDALVTEAGKNLPQAKRMELFQQIEDLLATEAPINPLYYESHNYLVSPSVVGLPHNRLATHPLKGVSLK